MTTDEDLIGSYSSVAGDSGVVKERFEKDEVFGSFRPSTFDPRSLCPLFIKFDEGVFFNESVDGLPDFAK